MNPLLARLLRSQAYRELGSARLYEGGLPLAPDAESRVRLQQHAREEVAHHAAVIDLWSSWSGQAARTLEASVEEHLANHPLPEAAGWLDLVIARFLFDRAGYWQLREYDQCAFLPYRELARRIVGDEEEHFAEGARGLAEEARRNGAAAAQAVFDRWLPPAFLSFGRPGSAASREAIALHLKRRDPAEVMQDFVDDIGPAVASSGLRLRGVAGGIELPAGLRWPTA